MMAQNPNNVVYQPQIGFGTKVYKKVTIANTSDSKPSMMKPVTLVTVRPPANSLALNPPHSSVNNNTASFQRLPTMDGNGRRTSSKTRNGNNPTTTTNKQLTFGRPVSSASKTSQKPTNCLVLTAKNRIPLRKQLRTPNESTTPSQTRTNIPSSSSRLNGGGGTTTTNTSSSNHGQLRNRTMTLRNRFSRDELSKTASKTTSTQRTPTQGQAHKYTATVRKVLSSNQASGDHNSQTIQITRKAIPPVRLTAVVNITQGCSDEGPTTVGGTFLTEVPPSTFTTDELEQSVGGDTGNEVSEDVMTPVVKLVTKKKRLTTTTTPTTPTTPTPILHQQGERLKGGSESVRSRHRRFLKPQSSARSEMQETKEDIVDEPIKLTELGIQTNEYEINNHSLLVGDIRYVTPSASVIAEIEKARKEEKAKNLSQSTRKFTAADQQQEQHIDELNEFLQQSYITKKPRNKVRDPFEADRKLMSSMDIILNREVPKTESITNIKERIKLKEKELLSLFDNVQTNTRR